MEKQLQDLIDLLKQTAPYLYEICVRQARNTGIVDIVLSFVLIAGIYGLYKAVMWMRREVVRTKDDGWNAKDYDFQITFSAIGILLLTVFTLLFFSDGLLHVLNPEYYAIKTLLGH